MKLCYVASGISIHSVKWLDWFANRGHEVHLITPPYDQPLREFHPSVKVHVLPKIWPVSWRGSRLINMPVWIVQAGTLVRQIQPDLVEGQYIGVPGYIAMWTAYSPLVLQAWGSDILLDVKRRVLGIFRPYRGLTIRSLSRADMVLCDSETVKQGIESLGTDMSKVKKMCNGVDTELFSPSAYSNNNQIVISTRSLEPVYNVADTIRAFKLVLEHFPKATLVIVGDGKCRDELQDLVTKLSMRDRVVFTGTQDQVGVRNWLRKATVYVSTSLSDSTSLCLLEAMAVGLPSVASDLPANQEWISDNGYLAPIGDIQTTANRIKMLLRDDGPRSSMGRRGREKAIQRGDLNANMLKVEQLYEGLIR